MLFHLKRLWILLGLAYLMLCFWEPLASYAQGPEVVERRTATSKHYQLGPHLYEAHISTQPIHYRDNAGQWQDIDLRPVNQTDGSFAVMASPVKIGFPTVLETGLDISATVEIPSSNDAATPELTLIDGKLDLNQFGKHGVRLKIPEPPQTETVFLQWQPQPFRWVQNHRTLAPIKATFSAHATTDSVSYDNETTRQQFYPLADGLRHEVVLTRPPHQPQATDWVQTIRLKLPKNLHQYGLTWYNAAQQAVIDLTLPQLTEATGKTSAAMYELKPTEDGVELQIFVPMTWLTSAAYPIKLESGFRTVRATSKLGLQQVGQMWKCDTSSGLSLEDIIRVGNRSSNTCVADRQRALVQWDISALPITAVVAFPLTGTPSVLKGEVKTQLWHIPISSTGSGSIKISTYRMVSPWDGNFTTWLTRTISQTWVTKDANTGEPSGGDYLPTPEDSVNVAIQGSPQYVSMGSLHSLVGAWHTHQILNPNRCCFGEANYGLIYISDSEAVAEAADRVFARGLSAETAPVLVVTYFDSALLPPPNNQVFTVPRAPSPDKFLLNAKAYSQTWTAIAIQPLQASTRSDYDLVLSDKDDLLTAINSPSKKISIQRGTKTDFVVISPDINANLNAWAIHSEGTGSYYLKYLVKSPRLNQGDSKEVNITKSTMMEMYELNLTAGVRYNLELQNISGEADLSMFLFSPASSQAFSSNNALYQIDAQSFGESERLTFVANQTGIYGLAVLNNGLSSGTNSTFVLKLQKFTSRLYLPLLLKQPPPAPPPIIVPDNGGFEANLDKWTTANPGGPLVVSVTSNFDTACFEGDKIALIGTVTGKTDLITNIPIDKEAILSQQFKMPDNAARLEFNYQVFSYDLVQSSKGIVYDYFAVRINGTEQKPPDRVGNPALSLPEQQVLEKWDSKCQTASIDVSAYAGQNITLEFLVRNGVYNDRNTWAYVDKVKVTTK